MKTNWTNPCLTTLKVTVKSLQYKEREPRDSIPVNSW